MSSDPERKSPGIVQQVARVLQRDGVSGFARKLSRFVASRLSQHKSQKGQDRWVLETLRDKRNGYFVDLAASDGVTFSNSWILEKKYGWQGIAIEPNPSFVDTLKRGRNCLIVDVVVDSESGTAPFRVDNGSASGIVADDTDNNPETRGEDLKSAVIKDLPSKTLTEILDEAQAPATIDYLSLDVEGAEERVIRGLNLEKYTFHCITIERPNEFVNETLFSRGYRFVKNVRFDTFYIHESHPHADQVECEPFEQVPDKEF